MGYARAPKLCWSLAFLLRAIVLLCIAQILKMPVLAWELPKKAQLWGQKKTVQVSPSSSLYEVARQHGYSWNQLARANSLSSGGGSIGRTSLILPSQRILPSKLQNPGIIINLPECGGYLINGEVTKFFPVAIGQPGRFATPTGSFFVTEKVRDPSWIAPQWAGLGENNVVAAGPDNPLGDRWIGLSSPGLGMHSTTDPASIGSAASHGCMRMYPEIARSIFDAIEVDWPIRIEYETVRVGLDRSGIYVSAFPDIYGRQNSKASLLQKFQDEDIQGFYVESLCTSALEAKTGTPVKVVDLSPKVWVNNLWFPAARIGSTIYIEQGALEAVATSIEYSLSERSVRLTRNKYVHHLGLYLPLAKERLENEAFLSRGSCWLPARKTLEGLGLSLNWEAKENRARIELGNVYP